MELTNLFLSTIKSSEYTLEQDYPIKILALGIFISLLCGLTFAYLMRKKIRNWENKKESPLPLATAQTIASWIGFFIGLIFIFIGVLLTFNFPLLGSTIFAVLNSLLFGITMWRAIKDLMIQLESGSIKEIDDYL